MSRYRMDTEAGQQEALFDWMRIRSGGLGRISGGQGMTELKYHPDGTAWTLDELAAEDGCCPHCWPNAKAEIEAGMPFKGMLRKTGEKRLNAGEVRVNKAAWGFEELKKHVMHIPYLDKNGKEWAAIDVEIAYCPFCGKKLEDAEDDNNQKGA